MLNIKSYNPANLELVGEVKEVDPDKIGDIIVKARNVQKQWEKFPVKDKKKLLSKLLKYVGNNMDEIAKIICAETGKPRIEAINSDILAALAAIRYSIDYIDEIFDDNKIKFKGMRIPLKLMGRSSYISPKPLGLIGIISPWNFPFGIPFSQSVMAITAGNSVILKPSSETPLTGKKIQDLFDNNGFPKYLIQTIPGGGSKIGDALIKSNIDRIIFTGSVKVGKIVMKTAAQRLTPVTLELGGKSPMIILDDAEINRAVDGAIWGSFVNSGQMCAGVKRIYIHEKIFKEFKTKFKEKAENLKQGYGWDDPSVSMGPLINKTALEDMEQHVKTAVEQGAEILTGGMRNPNLKGYFFRPTILTKVSQNMAVVQKEIFGPIVPLLSFSSDEEAIELANDTTFGLYGSIWTTNIKRGKEIAERLTMGTISINNHAYTYGIPHTPWGGNKNSGFGRTHGKFGFDELIDHHHIHIDKQRIKEDPWWQPYNETKLDLQYDIKDLFFLKKYHKIFSLIPRLNI
jgi:succinate-semialdehyde dehydrogenase/glutarate-semialdehyde dehydrogenase